MDDVKHEVREGEKQTKQAWRDADGNDSLTDKIGNAGDEIREQAGDAGDAVNRGLGDTTDTSKAAWRRADGEDLADKVGNAGDDIRRDVTDILTASDDELIDCMRFFATRMKLVAEPTGCLAFAGARAFGKRLAGRRVGVIVSGGNIDAERMARLLQ